jgi:hypothetical protein
MIRVIIDVKKNTLVNWYTVQTMCTHMSWERFYVGEIFAYSKKKFYIPVLVNVICYDFVSITRLQYDRNCG